MEITADANTVIDDLARQIADLASVQELSAE